MGSLLSTENKQPSQIPSSTAFAEMVNRRKMRARCIYTRGFILPPHRKLAALGFGDKGGNTRALKHAVRSNLNVLLNDSRVRTVEATG